MLEPLFRCNLACAGCGKIDYPDEILNQRLSVEECLAAVDECGAPVVSIAGGEPLLHKEIRTIVEGIIARSKFVYLCTNALLMKKRLSTVQAEPVLRLVGPPRRRPGDARQARCARRASTTARWRRSRRPRPRLSRQHQLHAVQRRRSGARRALLRQRQGAWASTASPSRRATRTSARPTSSTSSIAPRPSNCSATSSGAATAARRWSFSQSGLFLDFLAGNQDYHCTPWGNPTRTVFGWQRPCYLLGEGYAKTFRELMDETDWDQYGTGNYEKCADCMVHCGFEATAVSGCRAASAQGAAASAGAACRPTAPMAQEISLEQQRPAQYVFSRHVEQKLAEIRVTKAGPKESTAA